jgi:hypothetical protein
MMTNSMLADNDQSPFIVLEYDDKELCASWSGEEIWWRDRANGNIENVTRLIDSQWKRATTLLEAAECSPRYDTIDKPHAPSLDDVRAAFAAGRIGRSPRRRNVNKIYCYLKPQVEGRPFIGVAADENNNTILEHPSTDAESVRAALGFDTINNHDKYDVVFGRGNWELEWIEDAQRHPAKVKSRELAMKREAQKVNVNRDLAQAGAVIPVETPVAAEPTIVAPLQGPSNEALSS